jgi:putative phosphoribosyl transferase
MSKLVEKEVKIPLSDATIEGNLRIPPNASGIVLFAHGSGSGRFSPRNQHVAKLLEAYGVATLLIDLLTQDEEQIDEVTRHLRFDIPLLSNRLIEVSDWLGQQELTKSLPIGYFGASTGAGAALIAAAKDHSIRVVVSRGGRPDLAGHLLSQVVAPTLLIVGGNDDIVIGLNQIALNSLASKEKTLKIIPGATHLFEEPGKLDSVAKLAGEWFATYLTVEPESKSQA